MKRYYKLDSTGIPLASYARKQPGQDLLILDNPENNYQKWNGKKWVENTEIKLEQEKEILIQNKIRQIAIDALIVDGVWTE